jgi:hypothetical protein
MKGRFIVAIAIICLLAGMVAVSDAEARKGKYWCEKEGHGYKSKSSKGLGDKLFMKCHFILMNKDELDLSDDQAEKVMDIKVKAKKNYIMKKAEIDAVAVDMKVELWKDELNVDAINKLIDTKYALKAQKKKDLVASYAELKKTISSAQMDKLKELWKQCETE